MAASVPALKILKLSGRRPLLQLLTTLRKQSINSFFSPQIVCPHRGVLTVGVKAGA